MTTKDNKTAFRMKKIEKNKAACWCCDSSTIVDIRKTIECIKTSLQKTQNEDSLSLNISL